MPKEWILNTAINRWGLQKKKMVGAVSEEIRKCAPRTLKEWEKYYYKYKNVYPKEHLIEIVVLRRIENKPIIFVQIILPLNL